MIRRWSARIGLALAAMSWLSPSRAGVWGVTPTVGISGNYNTNPALLNIPDTAETNGALLLDAPFAYNADAFSFTLVPSFRVGGQQGYNSLDSDYEHLTAKAEFDNERGSFTMAAAILQDSTLYHDYLFNGAAGVRRDAGIVDLNWDRQLTERIELGVDLNGQQVRYGEAVGAPTLSNYKYVSLAPTLSWINSERDKLTASMSAGFYESLDGTTRSKSINVQLGYVHQLQEMWSWSAAAGYSHAINSEDTYQEEIAQGPNGLEIVLVPVRFQSAQNGTVFSATITRQSARLMLSATASRQLVPTGFAYLSAVDLAALNATYALSARWSLGASASLTKYQNPAVPPGKPYGATVGIATLQATWQWTEHWTVTTAATYVHDNVTSEDYDVQSSGISVTLSRQFNRIGL